jgi:hypothetical protein
MKKKNNNKTLAKSVEFDIDSSLNIEYKVKLENIKDEKLLITINSNSKEGISAIETNFTLKNIKENSYFSICKNIQDVLNLLIPEFQKNDPNLIEDKKSFKLIVPLSASNTEIIFFLKKQKKFELNLENLYNIIKEQNKNINSLENKIKDLENQIQILKQNQSIGNYKNFYKIRDWISNDKNMEFKLLFSLSNDGIDAKTFHDLCDHQFPTIILIETTKGYQFGGFTPLDWYTEKIELEDYENKTDNETFLFSLDFNKKYEKKNNNRSICCNRKCGPMFGAGCDLKINNPLNKGFVANMNYNTFVNDYELTHGEAGKFDVKELEVYLVQFYEKKNKFIDKD